MEAFPFIINLNFKMEIFNIKPPTNFSCLLDVASEKFNLKVVHFFYATDNRKNVPIKNDNDYVKFLTIATESELKEYEVIVKDEEDISNKNRKKSMRKRSTIKEMERAIGISTSNGESKESEGLNDIMCDYDYFGDTRNRKAMMSEGRWSNQSNNYDEKKRIYYIKEKKNMQREEQMSRIKPVMEVEEEYKSNKRVLKIHNKCVDPMEVDDDEGSNKKNNRKKKK